MAVEQIARRFPKHVPLETKTRCGKYDCRTGKNVGRPKESSRCLRASAPRRPTSLGRALRTPETATKATSASTAARCRRRRRGRQGPPGRRARRIALRRRIHRSTGGFPKSRSSGSTRKFARSSRSESREIRQKLQPIEASPSGSSGLIFRRGVLRAGLSSVRTYGPWSRHGGTAAGGSWASAARSISAMNDCDVFWTSRMKRPAWRMTFGSRSGPKSKSPRDAEDEDIGDGEHWTGRAYLRSRASIRARP